MSENKGLGSVNIVYQGGNYRKPQEGTVMAREQKRTKEVWKVKAENKSYADAVKDNSQRRWKGPAIFSKKKVLPWMKNSLVGQFREELNFEELGEEFVKGGMSMVRVRYMGDNFALLTLREGSNLEELIDLNKAWFESVFQKIEPWSEEYAVNYKVVWERCYGLPLTLWNKECFTKVVGEVGSLISIDESTVMWENLEFARLQVRVLRSSSARMAKSMKINGQVMAILLEEEQPTRLGGQCMCNRNYSDSSESISSSETYVEESDVSGFNSVGEDVHAGKVRRSEEELADGEDWSGNRTKVPLSQVTATRGIRMQNKDSMLITKEVVKGNEEVKVATLCYQSEHLCAVARNYLNGHAELARLVVDLECRDLQSQPIMPLGQQ